MKTRILGILKSADKTDEVKLEEIIGLAKPAERTAFDQTDRLGDELIAFRGLITIISTCDPKEVSISPKLCFLLASELANRTQTFIMAEARELFTTPSPAALLP
jgi:hypothetical protein